MIHINELKEITPGLTMHEYLEDQSLGVTKVDRAIEVAKHLPINGCITGSIWLPGFDLNWSDTPDIDIFVYSENDLRKAIAYAEWVLKMTPGTGAGERSELQEKWKLDRLDKSGLNYKIGITTYKFYCDGIIFNFTFKMRKSFGRWVPLTCIQDVLSSFDMSIVMQGYDIKPRVFFDMRPDNVPANVAIPNPLRDQDTMLWTVAKWIRQFDRVVKYYRRGIDTRPMAQFYLDEIDACVNAGCLFDSDDSVEMFDNFSKDFLEKRAIIADWLDAHKED